MEIAHGLELRLGDVPSPFPSLEFQAVVVSPQAWRAGLQAGGGHTGLITAPETHQRHPALALCLSSKLPAKGGSAPALHLVSFYGNRNQLLVGDGEAEVKGAGGGGERTIHNFCSSPKAPARGRDREEAPKKLSSGDAEDAQTPWSWLLGPAHLGLEMMFCAGVFFSSLMGFPIPLSRSQFLRSSSM